VQEKTFFNEVFKSETKGMLGAFQEKNKGSKREMGQGTYRKRGFGRSTSGEKGLRKKTLTNSGGR